MLRIAVVSRSTPRRARLPPAPKSHVGDQLPFANVGFRAACSPPKPAEGPFGPGNFLIAGVVEFERWRVLESGRSTTHQAVNQATDGPSSLKRPAIFDRCARTASRLLARTPLHFRPMRAFRSRLESLISAIR